MPTMIDLVKVLSPTLSDTKQVISETFFPADLISRLSTEKRKITTEASVTKYTCGRRIGMCG